MLSLIGCNRAGGGGTRGCCCNDVCDGCESFLTANDLFVLLLPVLVEENCCLLRLLLSSSSPFRNVEVVAVLLLGVFMIREDDDVDGLVVEVVVGSGRGLRYSG